MPYNPGIAYRGDLHILEAGKALADGIREFRSQRQRAQAADATMEELVKAAGVMHQQGMLPKEFADQLMVDAPKFPGMSTSQKEAKVGAVGSTMMQLMRGMAEQARERRTAAHEKVMEDLATKREVREAADSEANAKWRNAQADGMTKPPTFVTDPASGRTVVWHGNTMYPLPQPAATGPVTATPVLDASGRPIANALPTGNGGFRVLAPPKGATSSRVREALEMQRMGLLQRKAEVQANPGSRWNPFGKSAAQEIQDIDRQIGVIESQLEQGASDPESARPPAASAPANPVASESSIDAADEQRKAKAAIARGANPAEVARRYKARTGKDLM